MEEDKKIQTNKTEKVDGMVYLTLDFITSFIVIYITAGFQSEYPAGRFAGTAGYPAGY